MSNLRQHDELIAASFLAGASAAEVLEKYHSEFDAELREDLTKAVLYCLNRENGIEPVWANMNACRRGPGAAGVDRHFSERARRRMNSMSKANRDNIVKIAQRAGVDTSNKFYVGGLGRYGDSAAWVSNAEDLLTVAKKRNLNVQGAVKHEARPPDAAPKKIKMASDIMAKYVKLYSQDPKTKERISKNPQKELPALQEKILHNHTK